MKTYLATYSTPKGLLEFLFSVVSELNGKALIEFAEIEAPLNGELICVESYQVEQERVKTLISSF